MDNTSLLEFRCVQIGDGRGPILFDPAAHVAGHQNKADTCRRGLLSEEVYHVDICFMFPGDLIQC